MEAVLATAFTTECSGFAIAEHREQRALCEELSPLDVLDAIFSYVGFYIYTGAVSRRWNGRYMKLCYNKAAEVGQVAMDCGCDVAAMQKCIIRSARYIVYNSLETQKVLSLAKMFDYKWNEHLTYFACRRDDLQLLKWLHAHRCPIDVQKSNATPIFNENIEMLESCAVSHHAGATETCSACYTLLAEVSTSNRRGGSAMQVQRGQIAST
jgi:hypothetical protein